MDNSRYKFRFWVESAKKMADWETAKKECNRLSLLEMPGFIPMLFTGKKDKNGNEIYVSDIVNTYSVDEGEMIEIVEFQDGCFVFVNPNKLSWSISDYKSNYIEIVGNIYENPELLNQK